LKHPKETVLQITDRFEFIAHPPEQIYPGEILLQVKDYPINRYLSISDSKQIIKFLKYYTKET